MTNRNQTDTNEMATVGTKYKNDFILPKISPISPNFKQIVHKTKIKYQENRKMGQKYRIPIDLVMVISWYVYQFFGYRLTSV